MHFISPGAITGSTRDLLFGPRHRRGHPPRPPRLPGGGDNPVAVVRVPRERMIGAGIASSLIHEVGHQAAALLDLVNSLRPVLKGLQVGASRSSIAWQLWERWISEIVADLWSVARVGVASTLGLMGVVGLPRPFVFRLNLDDPHPIPWIRVKLLALGRRRPPPAVGPRRRPVGCLLSRGWPRRPPPRDLDPLAGAYAGIRVAAHQPSPQGAARPLPGGSIEHGRAPTGTPQSLFRTWRRLPPLMYRARPSLVFAVLGQARADGRLSPENESELLGKLLTHWALRSTLDVSAACALRRPADSTLQPILSIR